MVLKSLTDKLSSSAKALKFGASLGLATALSSFVAPEAEAQVNASPILNTTYTLRDVSGNLITPTENGYYFLTVGQAYSLDLGVKNTSSEAILDFSQISLTYALAGSNASLFDGLVSIDYAQNGPGAEDDGFPVPSQDLFANSNVEQYFGDFQLVDPTHGRFKISRYNSTETTPVLNPGETKQLARLEFISSPESAGLSAHLSIFQAGDTEYNSLFNSDFQPYSFSNGDWGTNNVIFEFEQVPEPSTYALLGTGLALAGANALRKRRKK